MFDWLRSPQSVERDSLLQHLTPHSRDALMDAIRTSLPPEGRPDTIQEALGGGTLDDPILSFLLSRYRNRAPQAAQPQATSMRFG